MSASAMWSAPAGKVLVVEDNAAVGRALMRTLSRAGFCGVGPVASGREACALGLREGVIAALVDIELADEVNGIEVARVLQQALDTRIVFTSGYGDADVLAAASGCVRCAYLRKPFSPPQLLAQLQVALEQDLQPSPRPAASDDARIGESDGAQPDDDSDLAWPLTRDAVGLALRVRSQVLWRIAVERFDLPSYLARVAVAVVQGCTRGEIAEQLGLSRSSVDSYVKQVYLRTRQHGRRSLALALCSEALG